MKKPTCTFSYGGLHCARRFFHSYLKETKKINNQLLNKRTSPHSHNHKESSGSVIIRGSFTIKVSQSLRDSRKFHNHRESQGSFTIREAPGSDTIIKRS